MTYTFEQSIEQQIIDFWDNDGVPLTDESNLVTLLRIIGQSYLNQSIKLYNVSQQFSVQTAEDQSLDNIGKLVGVKRQTLESDDVFSARIEATFKSSITSTTFKDTIEFVATLTDISVEDIEISYLTVDEPIIEISIPSIALNNTELSVTQIDTFINQVVPSSHRVDVLEQGTFEVRTDGETSDSSKGLIVEGGTDGGTLASSIEN